jgi:SAM-dependent methyltransferase
VRGYRSTSYGDGFADVYDQWYPGRDEVDDTVALVSALAGPRGRVLELGVGTGRLAIPLAAAGLAVTGVDVSPAMLARLAEADPTGTVTAVAGDMVEDLPDGPFDVVLVAYNTLFNLTDDGEQEACFVAVARRLAPGGTFVVEAFVPDEPFRAGSDVSLRSMTAEQVVLSVSEYDAERQTAAGHFVELTERRGVRLRPWFVRYSTVAQLDAMAAAAGLRLDDRWEDAHRTPFGEASERHVSLYRRPEAT